MRTLECELLHGNAATLVLALLAEEEGYGYRLRQELAARSRQYFQFAYGRLYPLLGKLERRGLVRGRWVKAGRARRRRYYVITTRGRTELAARRRQWRQFAAAMETVLARS